MRDKGRTVLAALCAGHMVNDSYSSVIFPLLPLIKDHLNLTTSQIFWLAPLYSITANLLQPVYGMLSDKFSKRKFAALAPTITACFVSAIGLAPSYSILILLLVGAGVGIGLFHPQAAVMASEASGERRRIGLAVFSAMGTIGYSLGPVAIALLISRYGLGKTYYAVGFGILISAIMFKLLPAPDEVTHHNEVRHSLVAKVRPGIVEALRPVWRSMLLLYLITAVRSGLQLVAVNYLPFLLADKGYKLTDTGGVLTAFLLLGGIGGLAGGLAAERYPGRSVALYSGLVAGPLMIAYLLTGGPISIVFLGASGFTLMCTIPVNVSLAQELAPERTSTVSALMMGAAWGMGALCPPALDSLVPRFGFEKVLMLMSVITLVTTWLAWLLPVDSPGKRVLVESEPLVAAGD